MVPVLEHNGNLFFQFGINPREFRAMPHQLLSPGVLQEALGHSPRAFDLSLILLEQRRLRWRNAVAHMVRHQLEDDQRSVVTDQSLGLGKLLYGRTI